MLKKTGTSDRLLPEFRSCAKCLKYGHRCVVSTASTGWAGPQENPGDGVPTSYPITMFRNNWSSTPVISRDRHFYIDHHCSMSMSPMISMGPWCFTAIGVKHAGGGRKLAGILGVLRVGHCRRER